MGTIQQIHRWSLTHHPRWLVAARVVLGVFLFVKGISFIINATQLEEIIKGTAVYRGSEWITLGITWVHLLGGFLIIIGLLTRWAVLLQIPILAGAVIFINNYHDASNKAFELSFAVVTLLLLIFFLVEGGGPLSLDNYFRKNPK